MRKARREGGEKREKGNVKESREKGIKQRKEGKERYTYEREMDEEGGKWRKKEEMGKREEGKGKGGGEIEESMQIQPKRAGTVLLTIVEFKNPLLNMSNVHVELTSSCNL